MNVIVIPEDFRHDQYLLKPIVEALFAWVGKPRANVRVLTDPLLGGVDKALDEAELASIFERYKGVVNLFLLIVDRDGEVGRRTRLEALEARFPGVDGKGRLLTEQAHQELEVWALAARKLEDVVWADVRAERDPKEVYFEPVAAARGLLDEPGAGRTTMGAEAGKAIVRVAKLCPEVATLRERLAAWIADPAGTIAGPYRAATDADAIKSPKQR